MKSVLQKYELLKYEIKTKKVFKDCDEYKYKQILDRKSTQCDIKSALTSWNWVDQKYF